MFGSLCTAGGVLYVGRHALTARVRPFDFEGRPLGAGFSFRGIGGGRAEATGIAVDEDRRVWVADRAAGAVRTFTLFGLELELLAAGLGDHADRPGAHGDVVDVATEGAEHEARIVIARGGDRRHALQLLDLASGRVLSPAPRGDSQGSFAALGGVAISGRRVLACETGAGVVQVFRDGEFHFQFGLPPAPGSGATFQPRAVALLADGRSIVVHDGTDGGALLLFDSGGRLLRVLASRGEGAGAILEPSDVAVREGAHDGSTLVAVLDRDGERVQVFGLDGTFRGAFDDAGLESSPASIDPASGSPGLRPVEGEQR